MRITARFWLLVLCVGGLALLVSRPAIAAELANTEVYRLEAGQVVTSDLIVTAGEVYIDGTVEGDLVAFAGLVEVNGRIEGDLLAFAGEVRINGVVGDDLRAGAAGVIIHGEVGDHVLAAAGGGDGPAGFVPPIGGRTVQQGFVVASDARVGGGVIVAAGGVQLDGTVGDDVLVAAGSAMLGGTVEGNAQLSVGALDVADTARVTGQLTYTAPEELSLPDEVAAAVRFEPEATSTTTGGGSSLLSQALRLLLVLLGFTGAAWLLLRFAPQALATPAGAIMMSPGKALLYGLVAALLLVGLPLLSTLIAALLVLFWGPLPGIMFVLFLVGAVALLWTLSPLVTGLWLGQAIFQATGRYASRLASLMLGVTVIVLLGMVPFVGWFVYLLSFLLAIGGTLLARNATLARRSESMIGAPG
ncbi:MAG: polymer-forming cytoskeletal protein [Chloroflexia bacterium]|nr:polymer-forming cytoskeletal protein [Chloroflexia bacterium]